MSEEQLTPATADNQPPKLLKDRITEWLKFTNTVIFQVQEGGDTDRMAREIIESFLAATKLAPALHGEPIFVLRAQDMLAPDAVRNWVDEAEFYGAFSKAEEAFRIYIEMRAWQQANPTRVKIPD